MADGIRDVSPGELFDQLKTARADNLRLAEAFIRVSDDCNQLANERAAYAAVIEQVRAACQPGAIPLGVVGQESSGYADAQDMILALLPPATPNQEPAND